MEFVIETQGLENYGRHQEDGKFASGNHYWKFKSGTTYLVSGLDRLQDAMAFVAAIGMDNSLGWKEYPAEGKTRAEWESDWDMNDPHAREYREFKLQYMQKVDPRDPDSYKKFLVR